MSSKPIRHGGVFTRYCFADLSQCAGDHQIADRQWFCKQLIDRLKQWMSRGFPRPSCDLLRNAGRIFPATPATDNCLSLLLPSADLVDPFSLIATVKLASINTRRFDQRIQFTHCVAPLLFYRINTRHNLRVTGSQRFIIGRRCFDNRRFALQITINIAQQRLRPFPVSKTTGLFHAAAGSSGDARNRRRPGSVAETHLQSAAAQTACRIQRHSG